MVDPDNYIKSHELAWNAGWKAALDSKREAETSCTDYIHLTPMPVEDLRCRNGWNFCPECGARI